MTEGEGLFDAIFVGRMDGGGAGQRAAAFRIFGLQQMAFAGAGAQDFAGCRNFETLGSGFFRFNAFGTSHNRILKKSAQYTDVGGAKQGIFKNFCG